MNLGWAGKVMSVLAYATQLVILNVLWFLGVVAGGIVLGVAPATRALGRLSTALVLGEPSQRAWHDFWFTWRSSFWETNRKAWPFTVLFVLASVNLVVFKTASEQGFVGAVVLFGPFLIVAAGCMVAYAFFHASLLRFNDGFGATLRFSFVSPIAFLPTTFAILLILTAFFAATWQFPVLSVLGGFSIPIGLSIVFAGKAMDKAYGASFLADDVLLRDARETANKRAT